jgi:hypothetical protein
LNIKSYKISQKHQENAERWGGVTAEGRRMAYIKRHYDVPHKCNDCSDVAHWVWKRNTNTNHLYFCKNHLPEAARTRLNNFVKETLRIGNYFDELPVDNF